VSGSKIIKNSFASIHFVEVNYISMEEKCLSGHTLGPEGNGPRGKKENFIHLLYETPKGGEMTRRRNLEPVLCSVCGDPVPPGHGEHWGGGTAHSACAQRERMVAASTHFQAASATNANGPRRSGAGVGCSLDGGRHSHSRLSLGGGN